MVSEESTSNLLIMIFIVDRCMGYIDGVFLLIVWR